MWTKYYTTVSAACILKLEVVRQCQHEFGEAVKLRAEGRLLVFCVPWNPLAKPWAYALED